MTIGNVADAALALTGTVPILGSGNDRTAYLINGVVYKVAHCRAFDCWNRAEYTRVSHVQWWHANIKVPETSLFEINDREVIAMEYIDGEPVGMCFCQPGEEHFGCITDGEILSFMAYTALFTDIAYGNVIRDMSGIYWIVDFGE